jgi:homospermidine synthase
VIIIAGITVALLMQKKGQQQKKMVLINEITKQEKLMDSLNFRSVTVYINPANQNSFHYFKDCMELGLVVEELSIEQIFHNDITSVCEICVNRITEFENSYDEAILSVRFARNYFKEELFFLSDDFYFDALEWTNKALQMRPDHPEMLNLQKDIQDER